MGDAPRPDDMTPIQQAQAYASGRSDDISRELVAELIASHRAMQQAGEEMPDAETVYLAGEAAIARGEPRTSGILNLFRSLVARLTQDKAALNQAHEEALRERDALRQRAERAERERDAARRLHGAAQEEIGRRRVVENELRARLAELEASREPGADVVEGLAVEAERAYSRAIDARQHNSTWWPSVVRAVLAHLATMCEEVWPSNDDVEARGHLAVDDAAASGGPITRLCTIAVRDLCRSRLSPVLGALRARVAELEAASAAREGGSIRVDEQTAACETICGRSRVKPSGETVHCVKMPGHEGSCRFPW